MKSIIKVVSLDAREGFFFLLIFLAKFVLQWLLHFLNWNSNFRS